MRYWLLKWCIGVVLASQFGLALGQMVIQADTAKLQPLIGRDAVGFQSCGVRASVVSEGAGLVDNFDFSLMLRRGFPYGTLKAGKSRMTTEALMKREFSFDAVLPRPIRFWIAQEAEGKPIFPIKAIDAESKGYVLEVADFVDTYGGILAMIHGRRMQFSVRYESEPVDIVVSFSAEMPEVERTPLMSCLDDLIASFSKMAKDGQSLNKASPK